MTRATIPNMPRSQVVRVAASRFPQGKYHDPRVKAPCWPAFRRAISSAAWSGYILDLNGRTVISWQLRAACTSDQLRLLDLRLLAWHLGAALRAQVAAHCIAWPHMLCALPTGSALHACVAPTNCALLWLGAYCSCPSDTHVRTPSLYVARSCRPPSRTTGGGRSSRPSRRTGSLPLRPARPCETHDCITTQPSG